MGDQVSPLPTGGRAANRGPVLDGRHTSEIQLTGNPLTTCSLPMTGDNAVWDSGSQLAPTTDP